MKIAICLAITSLAGLSPLAHAQDGSRTVTGGGITVSGWAGKIDANEERQGHTINDAKFAQDPVDARPYIFQGTCQFSPGQDGRTLNVASTAEAISFGSSVSRSRAS